MMKYVFLALAMLIFLGGCSQKTRSSIAGDVKQTGTNLKDAGEDIVNYPAK